MQTIGLLLLLTPFVVTLCFLTTVIGLAQTLMVFGITLLMLTCIVLGMWLITR